MKRQFLQNLDIVFGTVLLGTVAWFVFDFPILRLWLGVGFALYAACLWRWPRIWLFALPALLPTFDLAPWSGRFFLNEFDAFVLLTAGILALCNRNSGQGLRLPRALNWILLLLATSYAVGIGMRLWPLPPITLDSFADYYSPFNSLRVAKGFIWALLLYRPLTRALKKEPKARILLCSGFVAGLAGVSAAAILERWMFPGLLTLDTDYRVSATFSDMHTGDGPIDVWLATSIPMLAVLLLHPKRWRFLLLAIILFLTALYTLVAMQSRAPVIALLVAAVLGSGALLAITKRHRLMIGTIAVSGAALVLFALTELNLPQIYFLQRFETVAADARERMDHWRNSLQLRDNTTAAQIFGMGLGSFPLLHQLRTTSEPRSAHYMFRSDGSDQMLTMWSGEPLYMGQSAPVVPHSRYELSMKVRTSEPNASVAVLWCELWLLTSQNCISKNFTLEPATGRWLTLSATLDSGSTGEPLSAFGIKVARPTRFTFVVSNASHSGVDFGSISVKDTQGRELLQNGDFRAGADEWFWAEDDHLAWHVKNLGISVLLEQGWLGIFALGALLLYTCIELWRQVARKDPVAPILVACMTGFLVTAVTVSTFDEPRLALMFYLLCFMIICGGIPERIPTLPGGWNQTEETRRISDSAFNFDSSPESSV